MGARGKLKLASHLSTVDTEDTAAAVMQPEAPEKPSLVSADKELSALWDAIVPTLDAAGLIGRSDGPSVELALRHFLVARKASEAIGENITITDHGHGGKKKNPAEAVFRAESEMFLKYAQQLGMTFVSRARTPTKGDGDGEPNPFSASG